MKLCWFHQTSYPFPASYAKRFANGIAGPGMTQTIPGGGHLSYVDRPGAVGRAPLAVLSKEQR